MGMEKDKKCILTQAHIYLVCSRALDNHRFRIQVGIRCTHTSAHFTAAAINKIANLKMI